MNRNYIQLSTSFLDHQKKPEGIILFFQVIKLGPKHKQVQEIRQGLPEDQILVNQPLLIVAT